ncbi:hypothetical protein EIP75_21430 [Aquabacterium soli]|uniref:Uncharacterized protein n=1 Tax=Aquabacterium soli TaxID=2493092 RepID=A0A426V2K6_9BURK|nr:hypothetical protein [Aquabacterium soli]RRS01143.1 hypothetical protein EIP75_21430 [Aquabacterium soli]
MNTMHASAFDFRVVFPVPRDEERRRAGRLGLLDQKEDPSSSDADWVAFQHQAWRDELTAHYVERRYLLACIDAHADPGTGKPPRVPDTWWKIETRARAEVLMIDVMVDSMLGDYADHFGRAAADAFEAFVKAGVASLGDVGPSQRPLFSVLS